MDLNTSLLQAQLHIDYIYLDANERRQLGYNSISLQLIGLFCRKYNNFEVPFCINDLDDSISIKSFIECLCS